MSCALSNELIEKAKDFHGHWCPGLAIGLRAGEWVLENLGSARDEEIVAMVENDACGVDAVQVLTGCTFGKGNLVYRDKGKHAFNFHRRSDGKSARLVLNGEALGGGPGPEVVELFKKKYQDGLTPEEESRLKSLRDGWAQKIMDADLETVFEVKEAGPMPNKARIMASLKCDACGEMTMESRTRRLMGRTLCGDCFAKEDDRA